MEKFSQPAAGLWQHAAGELSLGKYVTKFCDFFTKTTNQKPQAVGCLCVFVRSQDGF